MNNKNFAVGKKRLLALILLIFFVFGILGEMCFMTVNVSLTSDHDGLFQLFYISSPYNFSEKKSVTAKIFKGANLLSWRIPHFYIRGYPRKNNLLRLDPAAEKDCIIDIGSFSVVTLWKRYDGLPEKKILAGIKAVDRGFLTLSDDPQIYLDLNKMQGHFSISWPMLISALIRGSAVSLIVLLFYICYIYRQQIRQSEYFRIYSSHGGRYITLWILFLFLVSCGVTLSNFGAMKENRLTSLVGEKKLLGKYRDIRTDEYMAHGILPAIQQYNHTPKFPLKNTYVGLSGRNYLMLHDTGAPVAHISSLARPAEWGFFLFDLRRALSWHSLFPVFFGFFSIWFLLDTLWDKKQWIHLLAAAAGVFTMTSASWTFWPIYNCAGTMLAAAGVIRLLRAKFPWKIMIWGVVIGWGGAVSAMTLYYPRVWYGGVLATAILAGGILELHLWTRFRSLWTWAGMMLGALLLTCLFYAWYSGVSQDGALDLMLNSAYPGCRRDSGGGMPFWCLCIGWFSPFSMLFSHYSDFYESAAFTNQCEIQKPMLILLPVLLYIIFNLKRLKYKWTIGAILACLFFFISFCCFHYPRMIVNILGMSRGNHWRMDYFIALGQIFLLTGLWHSAEENTGSVLVENENRNVIYIALMAVSIFLPVLLLLKIPPELINAFQKASVVKFLLYSCVMGGCYFLIALLIFHKFRWAVYSFLLLEFSLGVWVNPVCIAPVKLHSVLLEKIKKEQHIWKYNGRVMICTTQREHNLYAAATGMVFNGFFEYEDLDIYNLLLKDIPDAKQFHRLNHMMAMISSPSQPLFYAVIPQGDVIQLFFNGAKYDFRKLPIDYLLEPDDRKSKWLKRNPSLQYLDNINGYSRFCIRDR